MSLTEIICDVLDKHYSSIAGINDEEKDKEVLAAFHALTDSYSKLLQPDRQLIDYSSPATRFAYLYKYTVAHAEYFRQILALANVDTILRGLDTLKIACIGGGPGTEILGLFKYFSDKSRSINLKKLTAQIFDMERGWSNNWSDIEEKCFELIRFSAQFNQLDVTVQSQWEAYTRLNELDLISFSFFLSELYTKKEAATPFFLSCLNSMKPGAIVIYLDNYLYSVDEWFEEMCREARLEILVSKQNTILKYGNEEQVSDLGHYRDRFSTQSPRIKGNVSYIVAQKTIP